MKRSFAASLVALALILVGGSVVRADDKDNKTLSAEPVTFVGEANECGAGSAAGSNIVTSRWLGGMGLPDDGVSSNTPSNDRHQGLLLSKNGPTHDCSAAGANIKGVKGLLVTESFALGFDNRNGSHCGAGAARFNIVTDDGVFHFGGGCANGTASPAPQDLLEWTRIRILGVSPAQMFPPLTPGTRIKTIEIIYDEGTDAPSAQDANGVGLAVIDNIYVNGQFITTGVNRERDDDRDDDDRN